MKLGRKPEKQQTADKQIFIVTSDNAITFSPAFARDTLLAIAPPVPAALMPASTDSTLNFCQAVAYWRSTVRSSRVTWRRKRAVSNRSRRQRRHGRTARWLHACSAVTLQPSRPPPS